MKNYRNFFILTTIFTLVLGVLAFCAGDYIIKTKPIYYKDGFMIVPWLERKMEISNAHQASKRLIIFGGSNVLFGANAKQIEKELGITTLNMGLHAGLGTHIFKVGKQFLKKGDIVLMPLEYKTACKDDKFDSVMSQYILTNDTAYYKSLALNEKIPYIYYLLTENPLKTIYQSSKKQKYIEDMKNKTPDSLSAKAAPYSHLKWDELGDVTTNIGQRSEKLSKLPQNFDAPKETPQAAPELLEFAKWTKDNDIRLYATFPVIYDYKNKNSAQNKEYFKKIRKLYEDNGIAFVGTYEDAQLDKKYFYDSIYHLNSEGQKIWSARLAKIIKAEIPSYK